MDKEKTAIDVHDTAMHETSQTTETAFAEGYRQMAADREREIEAEEWTRQILFVLE